MDPRKPIQLRRSELYQRVWEIPMVKLAPELGLSDVGQAKLCCRWVVPVPTRGPTIAPYLNPRE